METVSAANDTKKKDRRRWLPVLALAALVLLWFWGAREQDYYTRSCKEIQYVEGYEETTDHTAYQGKVIAEGFEMNSLYPGEYELTIDYKSTSDQNYYEVVDQLRDTVLATGFYTAGQDEARITVALTQRVQYLIVRSVLMEGDLTLGDCDVVSLHPVYTDSFWALGLIGLLGAGLWLCLKRYRAGRRCELGLYTAAALLSLPLLTQHLQHGHDIAFHLTRIDGLAGALLSGQFPVRLNVDFMYGGGYISPIMYPELMLYVPGVLCAAGASVLFGYKVLCAMVNFVTAFAAFQGGKQIAGEKIGFIFAVFYLLNPYRLNNLYVRAAIGEVWAMAFMPLAMAGLYLLLQGDYKKGFWFALWGITGVYQSHMISTLLLIGCGVLYGLGVVLFDWKNFWKEPHRILTIAGTALATIGVNLWLIVPFLSYSRWNLNIFHTQTNLWEAAPYLYQMFMDGFSKGGELGNTTTTGEMSFSIGAFTLMGAVVFLFYLLCTPRMDRQTRYKGGVCLMLGSLALFMASDLFPWKQIQSIEALNAIAIKLQFAWRLLVMAALFYSFVAAIAFAQLWQEKQLALATVMAVLSLNTALQICSGYISVMSAEMTTKSENWDHNMLYQGQYILQEHSLATVCGRLHSGGVYAGGNVIVSDVQRNGVNLSFQFEKTDSNTADCELPLYYYGLHRATLSDGTALTLGCAENGMIRVTLPAEAAAGTVQVQYTGRKIFRLSELASALTLAGLAAGGLYQNRRKKNKTAQTAAVKTTEN